VRSPYRLRRGRRSEADPVAAGNGGVTGPADNPVTTIKLTLPVGQTAQSTLVPDLTSLLTKGTTAKALIDARVGQGQFRTEVLQLWGNRCCVTGIETTEAIRASHIKPWRSSTDAERLDPANGLPLNGTLDGLFDGGLISFASDGNLLASGHLSAEELRRLGVVGARLHHAPEGRTAEYLAVHRDLIFRKL
jgi:putative restriction endonuclease